MKNDICGQEHAISRDTFIRNMPDDAAIGTLSDMFKILGDPTRVKIISALRIGELCVCELCDVIGMSQSAVSHQLRLLRSAKVVKARREGKSACYSLHDAHIQNIFTQALNHVTGDGCC